MAALLSREEARERLSRIGKTAADVARELGVSPHIAAGVLAGRIKGSRGDAHKVAVALGLKNGVVVARDMTVADALRALAA